MPRPGELGAATATASAFVMSKVAGWLGPATESSVLACPTRGTEMWTCPTTVEAETMVSWLRQSAKTPPLSAAAVATAPTVIRAATDQRRRG
jgi:hypothetical protein